MPAALIETTDYPAVRAAIDATLDEASLPDDVIALDIYKGLAIALISESTVVIDVFTKGAAITLCAALIAPTIPALKLETDAGITTEIEPIDYAKRAQELRTMSSQLLSLSLNTTPDERRAAQRPTQFTAAGGTRGQ